MLFKRTIIDLGKPDLLIWKNEQDNFPAGTYLTVYENQSAVFLGDGRVVDILGPGKHALTADNYPFLNQLNQSGFGRKYTCSIYFVNEAKVMRIPWGIGNIRLFTYVDEKRRVPMEVGCNGDLELQLDPEGIERLFVTVLSDGGKLEQDSLMEYAKGIIVTYIRSHMGATLQKYNIFELDQYLLELSQEIQPMLEDEYLSRGLLVRDFKVKSFALPERDPVFQQAKFYYYQRFTQANEIELAQEMRKFNQDMNPSEQWQCKCGCLNSNRNKFCGRCGSPR